MRLSLSERVILRICLCLLLIASSLSAQESSPAGEREKSASSQVEIAASGSTGSPAAIEPAVRPQMPAVIASISPADMKKYRKFDAFFEKGWEVAWPSTAQSILQDVGGFRSKLYERGFGFFGATQSTFTYNLAQPPQPDGQQSFIGGRPSFSANTTLFLTYNIPSKNIQLSLSGTLGYGTWTTGMGPNIARIYGLQYHQGFLNDKIQVEAGYLHNSQQFVGLQTGGSLASGSLGPRAVLPYLVGLSTTFTSPGVNVTYHLPKNFYGKTGLQSSPDPVMFDDNKHDAIGFRFTRDGLGLLTIQELGYRRNASPEAHQMWIRFGGMYNTTDFARVDRLPVPSPTYMPNNWNVFLGADRQLVQFDKTLPFRGLYGGLAWQYNPPRQNVYTQLREVRLYATGLFRNRPFDMASVVVANIDYSKRFTSLMNSLGRPTYGDTTGVTGSYSFYVRPGVVLNTAIGYTRHVTPTPRIDNPVNLTVQLRTIY